MRFNHIGVDDGLSMGEVLYALQGPRGYIWFATRGGGIDRFDGYTVKHYRANPFDSTGLAADYIWTLFVSEDSTLWAGTDKGLHRFDVVRDAFVQVKMNGNGSATPIVTGIVEDSLGRFYLATISNGLGRYDRSSGEVTYFRNDASDARSLCANFLGDPYRDRSGTLWFPSYNGICRLEDDGRFTRFLHDESITDPFQITFDERSPVVTQIIEDARRDGIFWAWTYQGLRRFDPETGEAQTVLPRSGGDTRFGGLLHDPLDPAKLWIATENDGLYHFDTRTKEYIRYAHDPDDPGSLASNYLTNIFRDHTDVIWLPGRDGVSLFDPYAGGFRNLEAGRELPEKGVHSVLVDGQGRLWIGTSRGLLSQYDRTTGQTRTWQLGPDNFFGDVYALHEEADGTLWAGSPRGLHRYDPRSDSFETFKVHPAADDDLYGNPVVGIYEIRDAMWIRLSRPDSSGVWRDAVYQFDRRRETFRRARFDPDPSNAHPAFQFPLRRDPAGRTWWSVENGLAAVSDDTVRYFQHDPSDPQTLGRLQVVDVAARPEEPEVVWATTYGGGLSRIDIRSGRTSRFTQADGLPDERLLDIQVSSSGELWISSDRGLIRFDPADTTFTVYGPSEGTQGWEFVGGASFKSESGEMFFGGTSGVTMFYPSDVRPNPHPPQIAFDGLRLFDEEVRPGVGGVLDSSLAVTNRVYLDHDQNVVTFEVTPLHFRDPAGNRLAYRLVGFDGAWREARGRREITYTNLPPGDYRLRAKAANSNGVWSAPRELALTIRPPWWRTLWAYALFGLVLIGVLVGVDRFRHRQMLQRERHRAKLQQAQREAEAAEARSEALRQVDALKTRFFANVSHEFRTPLTLILGATDKVGDPEAARVIRRSARRLLDLIEQLLDLARLEAGRMKIEMERGDLRPFVEQQVRDFVPLAERRNIMLQFRCDEPSLPAAFDPDALQKIVSNLLSNALKFTPEKGKVWVLLRRLDDGSEAELIVKDTGPGIAPEDLPHLFERFYQADASLTRRHQGAGIGLTLAKEMAEQHGGSLTVESEPGFGSAFHVRLPVVEDISSEAAGIDRPSYARDAVPGGGPGPSSLYGAGTMTRKNGDEPEDTDETAPLVLIVDDHPEVRALVRGYVQDVYRVREAENGREALRKAREDAPDLVISDVMMAEMDGFDLCRRLRADDDLRDVPVILLTARAEDEDHATGLACGADTFLTKPFSEHVLRATAARLLERRREREKRPVVRLAPGDVDAQTDSEKLLRRVLDVAGEHLHDPDFTVDHLASEVGLSKRQLTRRLKETTDETPGAFLRRMRMERGRQLLQIHSTVSEVAYAVGYSSPSHFSRAFRSHFGYSPTEAVESDASDS